jgi:hypothetical protein
MQNRQPSKVPTGYVIRKSETTMPSAKAETTADLAAHMCRRVDFIERLGVDARIVRLAREMAPRHVTAKTLTHVDQQLDELLLNLRDVVGAHDASREAAMAAAISG